MILAIIVGALGCGLIGWGLKSWRLVGTADMYRLLNNVYYSPKPIEDSDEAPASVAGYQTVFIHRGTWKKIQKVVEKL